MPLTLTSGKNNSNSKGYLGTTADMVNYAQASNPYGIPSAVSGDNWNTYGMSSEDVTNQFNQAYQTASAAYDPFPTDNSKIDQLQALYQNVPQSFDVSGTIGKMQAARRSSLNVGQMAANSAAQQFQSSQLPGSNNKIGAGVLRAQSLLPYLQADTAGAMEEGKYADTAKQNALSTSAGIAKTLAELQQSYVNSLATYNSNKASQSLDYANKLAGLNLTASSQNQSNYLDYYKTQMQTSESARQANLQAALQNRSLDLTASNNATQNSMAASKAYLDSAKAPTGSWITDALGRVTSGQGAYNEYQNYQSGRNNALSNLSYL